MDEKLAKLNHYIDLLQEKSAIKWLSEKEEIALEKLQNIKEKYINEKDDTTILDLVWDTIGSIVNILEPIADALKPITSVIDLMSDKNL